MLFYLSSESIRTLALVLLNVALTGYLLRVPHGAGAARWLAGFTGATVVYYVFRGLEGSFLGLTVEAQWALNLAESVVIMAGIGALLQFAYRFLEAPFEREARVALGVSGLGVVGVVMLALAIRGTDMPRETLMASYTVWWLVVDLWAITVLLRKRRRALAEGRERSARAFLAFAGACAADAAMLAAIVVVNTISIPAAVSNAIWVFLILPFVFAVHYLRVAVYIAHAPEPTSLRVKLSGLTLAMGLAVIGMTGVLMTDPLNPNLTNGVAQTLEQAESLQGAMIRLLGLMGAVVVFALVVLPLSLQGSLVRPVRRLLDGVRRVNAGEREVTVAVGVRDEVGRLTEGFNAMTASLRDAEADLRAYAGDLERRVEVRTAALAASKAEVEAQAARLEEMDRLKTRFFANVSHEFRTPLTLLLGPIDDALAGRYGDVDPRLGEQLPVMQRNARRLLDLINQLLDLAKLEAAGLDLDRRATDLVALAQGVVGTFAARAERGGVALLSDPEAETLPAAVDGPKVEGVLTNLLANALAFTKPGGKVRVGVARDAEAAVLTVTDTGVGIAADDLPHVFDRFRQVDGSATRTHEGTGIGLALAKELVELHGGTIGVESTVGFGTRFTVRLPREAEGVDLAAMPASGPTASANECLLPPAGRDWEGGDEATATLTPEAAPLPEAADDRPTVLLVEDNADLRAFIRGHLTERYRVIEAADGQAGLEAARAHGPDLVLSDVMMPEMSGVDLTRALKADARLGDVPVVLLTARADEDSVLDGLGAGADDYLSKPFSPAELLARVDNFVSARRELRARYSDEVQIGPTKVAVPSAEAAFLQQARDVVEARLGDATFGVEALAEAVGLSRRQLGRRMRDALDTSPSQFVRELRLARAAQLLEQDAGTVAEVAYAVGYRDPEHFSKQFRKAYGATPSAYPEVV
ncbi:MAG: ATP-binding protein [Bacteroidota bacterium]